MLANRNVELVLKSRDKVKIEILDITRIHDDYLFCFFEDTF